MSQDFPPPVLGCGGVGNPRLKCALGGPVKVPAWAPPWAPGGALRWALRCACCDGGCPQGGGGALGPPPASSRGLAPGVPARPPLGASMLLYR
eukprot:875599-Pyramimonas_sp.AAC.1